ncbi:transmembrane protein, putative (macronuclear) [Tetrahymena thermophila SB210]|uniref:Transmembrane protein, putative n=1 Tax=Tetrahymena thermophila (strain SB210) TaxID=312017 RepID=Q239U8_TETTS|nr:transmembrane protein, putative [Tetrahymena thermophila SB210]EAR93310.2 transmembrane protein, putative [Tetrahymena thermophila SB210]|eukprot:XP_001013555.2 transmembrane protein, putative [Tetrahymena thermophila SB210]
MISSLDIHSVANLQIISKFVLNNSLFLNNTSFGFGGAIFLLQISTSSVYNSTFITNKALDFSGGAIYVNQSSLTLLESIFQNNLSLKERGGAICSENSNLIINQSQIIGNTAIIGGGIYYNQDQSLFVDLNTKLFNNTGRFYGNNIGSFPVKLLSYDLKKKQYNNYIKIENFQSGNYTKNPLYVQFIDQENRMISLDINSDVDHLSDSILQEIQSYQIQIQTLPDQKDLVIVQGNKLEYIQELNLFKLNITAGYSNNSIYQLKLVSQISNKILVLDLELDFRRCKIGEIRQRNQGFIQCYECQPGTYSLTDPYSDEKNIDSLQCLKCPQQYTSNCYKDRLILKDNYWRESNTTDEIYSCLKNGCSETNKIQINGCIKGYIGPLCDSCDYKGQYWNAQYALNGDRCVQCQEIAFLKKFFFLSYCI